jgi:hypothetical protein
MKIKFLKTGTEVECTLAEFDVFQQAGALMEVIQKDEVKKPDVLIKKEPKENS